MTTALAAPAPGAPLERITISRRAPRPTDGGIDSEDAGICHSDIHQVRDEWGPGSYPMVPGHEIVGVVRAVGSDVTSHRPGQRVGVGCFVNSCRTCEPCLAGQEQYCERGMVGTYNSRDYDGEPTHGGYATSIVVDANYVLHVPDSLDPAKAAPLLCAGITLYSPLKHWNAGPGTSVAIIGMGGLGHMGVKIAHALGADVTVLTQGTAKHDDALRLGANRCYATSDPETFNTLSRRFDLILNTVSVNLDIAAYLDLLKLDGTMVNIGIPTAPDAVSMFDLARGRRSLAASMIGGIAETQEMLEFCAAHGFGADIELITADQVNEAYERVVNSDVRYRAVIDISTL